MPLGLGAALSLGASILPYLVTRTVGLYWDANVASLATRAASAASLCDPGGRFCIQLDTTSAIERPERPPRRSTPDASTAVDLTGKVKWFDGSRGFGFVASDDFGKDVFVHSSILGAAGVASLAEGQAVSMRVVETPKGREAIAITL